MLEIITAAWMFWVIIGVLFVASIAALESDEPGFLVLLFLCCLFTVGWKVHAGIFTIRAVLQFFGAYVCIGAIWSIFKWWRNTRDVMEKYRAGEFNYASYAIDALTPLRNKGKILSWMMFWPSSVFWTATREIFNTIWDVTVGVFNTISAPALKIIEADEAAKEKAAEKAVEDEREARRARNQGVSLGGR